MNIKRFLKQFITDPNSPEGLIMRAEVLEETAIKEDPQQQEKTYLYAEVLRQLAAQNKPVEYNRRFIHEHLRP